jgi:hypothetical protein
VTVSASRVRGQTPVVLNKALSGERITEHDAVALLGSRDLVAIGRAANELRERSTDPTRVTFIVDRNLNYTNVCYTDCDFCAFYRRPGDRNEGYLLPKPVIFKKIEETLALGGTGLLMQATPASTRFPAAAPRSSSTASATSSRRRRRPPPSGSTSCATRTGWACPRRPR